MLRKAHSPPDRWRRCRGAIVVAVLLVTAATDVRANELEKLRAEVATLRAENKTLRARLEALEANPAPAGIEPGGVRTERLFVPRSRVSLRVTRDATSGTTSLATPWYRTSASGVLPRKEWIQVRAQQAPSGEITGAWLLLEREGGGGSAKAESGRFTVDGKPIEVRVEDYDRSDERRTVGQITSMTRRERVRFAIPPTAIGAVARANAVRFDAGSVEFELTDEHLSGFAALDVRAGAAATAVKPTSAR